ncbi:unnamed protein product, partial [Leptidea sinapis]
SPQRFKRVFIPISSNDTVDPARAKISVFTGPGLTSSIGAAISIAFAKECANLVIVGRNQKNLQKVARQCEINNRIPYVINADVTNEKDTKKIIDDTIKKLNKLDILGNNAGILRTVNLSKDYNIMEMYDELMKTNIRAVVDLIRLATPFLIQSKGNIVNISSAAGRRVFRVSSMILFVSFSLVTSALITYGIRLLVSHCFATFRKFSSFLPTITTLAHSLANAIAIAAPMPELAPVTITTFESNDISAAAACIYYYYVNQYRF